ncbi:MAG: transposase [Terrimonas sp.]|nr:transposase [Terrimonas sp.]OJY95566.1 MAG: transposase [Sphingobacteriales bacterium 40-81]
MKNTLFRGGYTIRDQYAAHFLTFTVCGFIDLLTRKVYKDILIDSFKYCQEHKGLVLNAFVIMTNHVHLIARATMKEFTLSDIVRDFKKYTHNTMMPIIQSEVESRRLWMLHQFKYYGNRNSKNEDYQIWTNNNHPEECFSKGFTDIKLNYIHQNPVRADIVALPEHYIYSSAANYVGKKGIIDIEVLY